MGQVFSITYSCVGAVLVRHTLFMWKIFLLRCTHPMWKRFHILLSHRAIGNGGKDCPVTYSSYVGELSPTTYSSVKKFVLRHSLPIWEKCFLRRSHTTWEINWEEYIEWRTLHIWEKCILRHITSPLKSFVFNILHLLTEVTPMTYSSSSRKHLYYVVKMYTTTYSLYVE